MKKIMKKSLSLVMALAVMLTGVLVIPTAKGNKAAAASPSFYGNQTVYYETDSPYIHGKSMCRFLTAPKQHRSRI